MITTDRQAAYVIAQRNVMRFFEEGVAFKDALLGDKDLPTAMTPEEINACFSPDYYTRHMQEFFARVFG